MSTQPVQLVHLVHRQRPAIPAHPPTIPPPPPSRPHPAGELLIKALYGQANELPASIFDLGISPFINASILAFVLLAMPADWLPQWQWLERLRQARKEGKQVRWRRR